MELIDKAAVVAEIKKRIKYYQAKNQKWGVAGYAGRVAEGNEILDYINNLEVKEVDLEKAARQYLLHEHLSPLNNILHQANLKTELQYHTDIENAFKAGFELGLNIQKGE